MYLENDIISLRPLVKKDALWMELWFNNPEIAIPYCGKFLPTTLSRQEKWIERVNNSNSDVRFGVYKKRPVESLFIGMVGLSKIDWYNRKACFGIIIGELRGQGYGKMAASMCINYGFYYLGLQSIWAECQADNIASSKAMCYAGFKFCGKWPQGCFKNGKYIDLHLYSINREQWNDKFSGEETDKLDSNPRSPVCF